MAMILYYLAKYGRGICLVLWLVLCVLCEEAANESLFFVFIGYFGVAVSLSFFIVIIYNAMLAAPMQAVLFATNTRGAFSDFCDIDAKQLSKTLYVSHLVKAGIKNSSRLETEIFRLMVVYDLEPGNFDDYFKAELNRLSLDSRLKPDELGDLLDNMIEQRQIENVIQVSETSMTTESFQF